ncbi:type II secretion system protein [Aliivibrio sp. S3MY1]|uniref:type IV pilus modification PilV family protein n=1 Tax=unclassified Aliivibrio TaxID=2645654 RepID=UPI002378BE85|nr:MULTISPECIES: type II secretion system protein [unclassified Aliivibrio]MDD9197084.1 type II secretion system protein [Aliivibrio sp. S3MY1]MDD9200196.1 type II secretion system protein [Aliivibrio sp. S2MY1]
MNRMRVSQIGLTLIESIVGIVILGFALSILVSGVFTSSTKSHQATYQAQAAALGHSIMTDVLSRQFDENSDPNGGAYRCGEISAPDACSSPNELGRDTIAEKNTTNHSAVFNDVDDFIGCWGEAAQCTSGVANYSLNQLIDATSAVKYKNFTVEINVAYADVDNRKTAITQFKKIDIILYASSHAQYTFSAYRGNY